MVRAGGGKHPKSPRYKILWKLHQSSVIVCWWALRNGVTQAELLHKFPSGVLYVYVVIGVIFLFAVNACNKHCHVV